MSPHNFPVSVRTVSTHSISLKSSKTIRPVHPMSKHNKAEQHSEADLNFLDLPPFPEDAPTAPLLRISLSKLVQGNQGEIDKLWEACRELGFFYFDLRGASTDQKTTLKPTSAKDLIEGICDEVNRADSATGDVEPDKLENIREFDVDIDGERLLQDAEDLFGIGKEIFDLPVEEKIKYDLKDQGSYFGYKGYGQGIIDAKGTKDRNEFYNVRSSQMFKTAEAHIHFRFRKTTSWGFLNHCLHPVYSTLIESC